MVQWKETIYRCLVYSGIARLSSFLHRDQVTILCFHAFSMKDEHCFWPGVFISKSRLIPILDYLRDSHFSVISLQEAERHLKGEVRYRYPVVLTVDDGWLSSVKELIPRFEKYQFPSTLYVTTYYCDHPIPVVNVLLHYWLWKKPTTDLEVIFQGETLHFSGDRRAIVKQIEERLSNRSDGDKTAFLLAIADVLGVNPEDVTSRRFHNATYDELTVLARSEFNDIQLHTHTHRLPEDEDAIYREIQKNKSRLEERIKVSPPLQLNHFCYPSGVWSSVHIPFLESLSLATATTLDEGLNAPHSDLLKLKRNLVLDHRSLAQLKVTMSGVLDIGRRWMKRRK